MVNKTLKVILWGAEVGRLKWDHSKRIGVFSYHPDFIRKGIDIAPLTASIHKGYGRGENVIGIPFRRENKFTGLPTFLADSLPDSWGKKLTTAWMQQYGTESRTLTPLDYLAYMGKRAMGALEFEPDGCPWKQTTPLQLEKIFQLADSVFCQRENVILGPEDEWNMAALCSVGTSAGGMQPKAVLAINNESGEIRSGQIIHPGEWTYYILKFAHPEYKEQCEVEMGYYKMALEAGISMMPSRLIQLDGKNHFLTERFDRVNGKKIHLQTLAAMNPHADSYEDIIELCDTLNLSYKEKEEMFRRMVFNVMAGCTDDHNRNFSFMMNKDGRWHITPAYDLTFAITFQRGLIEGAEHELSVRGKFSDISEKDLLLFAKENDIKSGDRIVGEVKKAVQHVYKHLINAGVSQNYALEIEKYLTGNDRRENLSDDTGLSEISFPHKEGNPYFVRAKINNDTYSMTKITETEYHRGIIDKDYAIRLATEKFKDELVFIESLKNENGFKR